MHRFHTLNEMLLIELIHCFFAESSGIVRVSNPLDYESLIEKHYTLTIIARDRGTPPQSSTAQLIVNVTDINDNKPIFSKAEYHILLSEGLPPEVTFFKFIATDADSGSNRKARIPYYC